MLKDIRTVKIQGANFESLTSFPLLCDESQHPAKAMLLYGRNGSGKSTIARAFRKIKGLPANNIQTAGLYDEQGTEISLSSNEKDHIYVFDEDFVNENVRVQEDGLGSIVMLGEQAGLAEQISAATTELNDAEHDCTQKKAQFDEYNDNSNPKSPSFYAIKMYSVLQQDNGWAGRKREIEGLKRNASVTDSTYKEFITISPSKSRDELIVEFSSQLEELKRAQSGASKISITVPAIPQVYGNYDVEYGNSLLSQTIERPELTERERYLMRLVQTGHSEELKTTAEEFNSANLTICPKCHQSLTTQYKADLIESIEKVLSEEVKNHQRKLGQMIIPDIEMDLSHFQNMPSYQPCIGQIDVINGLLHHNNEHLQAKIDDPYTPSEAQIVPFADSLSVLTERLMQLERERIAHNQTVADTTPIKQELTRINNEIAHWDIINYSVEHDKQEVEKQAAEAAWKTAQAFCSERRKRLNDLNAQRDSIDIAIDVINNGLRYIFFSENRMKIHVEDGAYKLLCNGHPVKPKDVSVGERNIIGLCYFFTNILERKSREEAHNEEYLLIIDDPVSSYDLENKVGILSYIKFELGKFFVGNNNSRALLMTHDLLTAIDIGKIYEELMADCKKKFNGQGVFTYSPKELRDSQLIRFTNKRNEYTTLISVVYEYAKGGASEQDPYIGNIIRQVLEAFSTFEFKKGIADVSTDDDILSTMEHEEYRTYFKNLMYRLVLNGDSHRYDQTRNMQIDFFTLISGTEKVRTAKEILCFMQLLNAHHIKAHLGDNAMHDIECWCEEIRVRSVTA
ncbi:MAG: AAA family ATPase [bacterium]|nr:AAA family ATPase [bacterium]